MIIYLRYDPYGLYLNKAALMPGLEKGLWNVLYIEYAISPMHSNVCFEGWIPCVPLTPILRKTPNLQPVELGIVAENAWW